MSATSSCTLVAISVAAMLGLASTGEAQTAVAGTRQLGTRSQLEAAARTADSLKKSDQAKLIRTRLTEGDFLEGDRIIVFVDNLAPDMRLDTLMFVKSGRVLEFRGAMGTMPLEGVLRSELEDAVRRHLSKNLRNPIVRASSLMTLGVSGSLLRQGFVHVAPDVPLSEVISQAGGYGPNADTERMIVRRGSETILDEGEARDAMLTGRSLDQLNLRAGDAVIVQEKNRRDWMSIMQMGVGALSLIIAVVSLSKR
jgi:hypothetical protein